MPCKYFFRKEVSFPFHVSVYFLLIFTNQEPVVLGNRMLKVGELAVRCQGISL